MLRYTTVVNDATKNEINQINMLISTQEMEEVPCWPVASFSLVHGSSFLQCHIWSARYNMLMFMLKEHIDIFAHVYANVSWD